MFNRGLIRVFSKSGKPATGYRYGSFPVDGLIGFSQSKSFVVPFSIGTCPTGEDLESHAVDFQILSGISNGSVESFFIKQRAPEYNYLSYPV